MAPTTVSDTYSKEPQTHQHSGPFAQNSFTKFVRIVFFFAIPIYAQAFISPSISSVFNHIFIAGSTGISLVRLSGGIVTIYQVGDVLYGIILCSLLNWSNSVPLLAWFVPDIEGWQGAVVHWMFMMRRLVYLLPNGKDIEALLADYKQVYPHLGYGINLISFLVIHFVLWAGEYPYLKLPATCWTVCSFIEYTYLAALNYIETRRYQKNFPHPSWQSEDMFKKELLLRKWLQRHRTGGITVQARAQSSSYSAWPTSARN